MLQDIAHFMTSISSTRSVRKEGLQHLYKQLHQNKAQLSELTGISNHIQYIIDLALQNTVVRVNRYK